MAHSPRLVATRAAFDALARGYNHSEENNELLVRLRLEIWRVLLELFPAGSRLLDLGCGTGIDATYLAGQGRRVVATDLSPGMVTRTRERADGAGVGGLVETRVLAIEDVYHELDDTCFHGIYSNRGPFNCVDDLEEVARACARLLPPGGRLVTTVIGRLCPWEVVYYATRGDWRRALIRTRRGFIPIPLQGEEVPTRYFTPRELSHVFDRYFEVESYRGLGLFLPPTYLATLSRRHPRLSAAAARLDDTLGGMPGFRNAGDMFLMVLRRR